MATMTAAEIRNLALAHLGVVAAGEAASAEDCQLVDPVVTAVVSSLTREGLVTFPSSAVPEWAQLSLRDIVAYEVAPSFGRLKNIDEWRQARRTLAAQTAGEHDARVVTPVVFF